MKAAMLILAFAMSPAFASDPVATSKIAAKKTSPARRVYDLILTTGFPANLLPDEFNWDGRKIREVQAPNDITFQGFATADSGSPQCLLRLTGRAGKVKEAEKLGLKVPLMIKDRRCTGQVQDVELTFDSPYKMETFKGTLTQGQLDIVYGLIEDCLKNGL